MSRCECEWLGDCSCELPNLPAMTPAKAAKVALKTEKGRDAPYQESATASEPNS